MASKIRQMASKWHTFLKAGPPLERFAEDLLPTRSAKASPGWFLLDLGTIVHDLGILLAISFMILAKLSGSIYVLISQVAKDRKEPAKNQQRKKSRNGLLKT